MDNYQTDDIGRLLRQLDLDQSHYRVFRSASASWHGSSQEGREEETQRSRGHISGPPIETTNKGIFEVPALPQTLDAAPQIAVAKPVKSLELSLGRESGRLQPEIAVAKPVTHPDQEWGVLESLFNLRTNLCTTERTGAPRLTGSSLFGACGGVGTTTILAALGRIGAKSARRVLLVDSVSPSFLPFYFGGQSTRSYISTFVSSDRSREHPIHVACGKAEESIRALASEIDRIYIDGGLFRTREASLVNSPFGTSLLVLVPDTRCLAELKRLEQQETKPAFILLNQYDPRHPLHREVQYLLSQKFRERLVPVTIGHDPDVSVALAQGRTIIDYAPDASVTEDLYRLDEWLAANIRSIPALEPAAVGQGL